MHQPSKFFLFAVLVVLTGTLYTIGTFDSLMIFRKEIPKHSAELWSRRSSEVFP